MFKCNEILRNTIRTKTYTTLVVCYFILNAAWPLISSFALATKSSSSVLALWRVGAAVVAHAAAFVDILARRPTFHVTRNAITTAKKAAIDVKITKILCQLVLKVENQGFLRKGVGINVWVELRRGQRTSFLSIVKSVWFGWKRLIRSQANPHRIIASQIKTQPRKIPIIAQLALSQSKTQKHQKTSH